MTYQIASGDTLGGIAKRKNTSVEALLKSNPRIKNPDLIFAGNQLNLPKTDVVEQAKSTPVESSGQTGATTQTKEENDLGAVIGERAGAKSDRDTLLERLTSGISGVKDYKPVERRQTLEKERGIQEKQEQIGSYEQEISKTQDLLDSLEADIKSRTGDFMLKESQRSRVEASERDPLMKQLGISQKGLGLAESGMAREQTDIDKILKGEKEEAYRPLELLQGELGVRETINKLFPEQDTDQVSSIIGAIQSGGSEDPLDIYNSLREQGLDVGIEEITTTLKQIQSVREEVTKDTQVVEVGGRKILIDKNTGATIKDLGGTEATGSEGPGYFAGGYSPDTQFTIAGKIDIERLPNLGGKRITDKSARQSNLPFGITDKQANWIEQHRPGNKQFQALAAISETNFLKGFGALAGLFELREDIAEIRALKKKTGIGPIATRRQQFQRALGYETQEIQDFSLLEQKTGKELVAFIKSISGVAVSDPERKMLTQFVANVSMQDEQFNSALDDYEDNLNQVILNKIIQYDFENETTFREAILGGEGAEESMLNLGEDDEVNVISPDGTQGTIPKSQLEEALAEGYTQQ